MRWLPCPVPDQREAVGCRTLAFYKERDGVRLLRRQRTEVVGFTCRTLGWAWLRRERARKGQVKRLEMEDEEYCFMVKYVYASVVPSVFLGAPPERSLGDWLVLPADSYHLPMESRGARSPQDCKSGAMGTFAIVT